MTPVSVLFIALALSMDALAVSIATGASIAENRLAEALRMGAAFGIFQALMLLIGAIAGKSFSDVVSSWDHWIAFAILTSIGIKMIYEAHFIEQEEKKSGRLPFRTLMILSVATSIDALAAGFSLSLFLGSSILTVAACIGLVTFIVCFIGAFLGGKLGHFLEGRIETAGGIILIAVGLHILISHS